MPRSLVVNAPFNCDVFDIWTRGAYSFDGIGFRLVDHDEMLELLLATLASPELPNFRVSPFRREEENLVPGRGFDFIWISLCDGLDAHEDRLEFVNCRAFLASPGLTFAFRDFNSFVLGEF